MMNLETTLIDLHNNHDRRGLRLLSEANPDVARGLIKAGKISCPYEGKTAPGACIFCDPLQGSAQMRQLALMKRRAEKALVGYLVERAIHEQERAERLAERAERLAENRAVSQKRVEQILVDTETTRKLRVQIDRFNAAHRL